MGHSAQNKKKRRRRMGVIAGVAAILVTAGIAWITVGGSDTSVTGDPRRSATHGSWDATELQSIQDAGATYDASA